MGNQEAEITQGQTLYVLGTNSIETVTVTKVGKQWFDYIGQNGQEYKAQLKFIAPANVEYGPHTTSHHGDSFFSAPTTPTPT